MRAARAKRRAVALCDGAASDLSARCQLRVGRGRSRSENDGGQRQPGNDGGRRRSGNDGGQRQPGNDGGRQRPGNDGGRRRAGNDGGRRRAGERRWASGRASRREREEGQSVRYGIRMIWGGTGSGRNDFDYVKIV